MILSPAERALLALDQPLPAVARLPDAAIPDAVAHLLRLLGQPAPPDPTTARRQLRAALTRRPPGTLPDSAWPLLDGLWAAEAALRPVVPAAALPRLADSGLGQRLSLWRGDITTLAAGAIVNAANAGLTGCYQPLHACVDNAIHTAAGPRLREDCGRVMAARGRPEPTATATATRGHFLPARYVLHTVGPMVRGPAPSAADADQLAGCYRACLDLGAALWDSDAGIGSVAFCGISTGVFGYPAAAAVPVVLAAVREWLAAAPDGPIMHRGASRCAIDHVIFVTYTAADQALYQAALREALHG